MVVVYSSELLLAFDFVSSGAPKEHEAFLSLYSGAIYWVSAFDDIDEELADDLESSDRYLSIPHKNDIDLGGRLALRFAAKELNTQYDSIERFFRHRGAYGRFKHCSRRRAAWRSGSRSKRLRLRARSRTGARRTVSRSSKLTKNHGHDVVGHD